MFCNDILTYYSHYVIQSILSNNENYLYYSLLYVMLKLMSNIDEFNK